MVLEQNYSQLELMQARVKFVPDGWAFNYVGKAFSIRNNLRKPISEGERGKNPGAYPYYGPTKVQGYIGTYEQDGSYALIGEDGDHFLKYKSHSMTQLIDGKCTVNNHAHIIEGTNNAIREWFYYYFMHRDIFSFLSRQGAGRYKLNKASLEKIPVLIPPIQEQKKIAQVLSTWDKAITISEQLLANSQQQKKALMQQLLTGKKRLVDKNGDRFSGEWKFQTISQISKRIQRKSDGEDHPILTISSLSGFVRQDERYSRYMAGESVKKYILLKQGEFAYNKGNSKTYEFGCIFDLDCYDTGLVPHVYVCFKLNQGLSHRYFKYLFEADYLKPQLGALVNKGVRNNGLLNIKPSEFMNTKVPVPCFDEQEQIADVLHASSETINKLQKKLDALKQEKKALMQQLLTGKRRVLVS
ncbi:restriction endonuclease subunit S [Salinivibrio kushneri]|uniref:restriction endonuclease subunit S n=1 Tax=Salinivibrio kushneri TaxID=1908198 RepID=UPI0009886F2A|nr:restriction endonuclease subunit S [Salinivibrio kushneri]